MKRRALIVLLSVAAMMLATIAPAVAADIETPSEIEIMVDPGGSVHVVDTVFDVEIGRFNGDRFVEITLLFGSVVISGSAETGFVIKHPQAGDGGICTICIP